MVEKHFYYVLWAFIVFMGLSLGSFLNVVIYRLPREKSVVLPGSACPACGTPIRWYDNLPVLSYLLLWGQCRKCGERISIRYPLIELLVGFLTVTLFVCRGLHVQTVVSLVLVVGMVAVAFIDAEHMIIPDELSIGGAVVGLALSFVKGGVTPLDSIIGAVAGAAAFGSIRWTHMKITGIEGMGLGDVKLAAAMGAFLGWMNLPIAVAISTFLGLIIGVTVLIIQRKGARGHLPLGTFLAIGTIVFVYIEPLYIEYVYWRMGGMAL